MTYEFKTASGEICCQTVNPAYLCSTCKGKAGFSTPRNPPPALAPALADSIRQRRATERLTPTQRHARSLQLTLAQPRPLANGRLP